MRFRCLWVILDGVNGYALRRILHDPYIIIRKIRNLASEYMKNVILLIFRILIFILTIVILTIEVLS